MTPSSSSDSFSGARPVTAGAITGPAASALGDRNDVRRLRALGTLALLELHPSTLSEGLEAVAGDVAVMDEEILRALVGGDEAVPLRIIEPFDDSVSHKKTPPSLLHERVRKALSANRTRSNCTHSSSVELNRRISATDRHKVS